MYVCKHVHKCLHMTVLIMHMNDDMWQHFIHMDRNVHNDIWTLWKFHTCKFMTTCQLTRMLGNYMCMNTPAWWYMTGLRDCMNETMDKCLHLTILHICMCQHVHTQKHVTVLQNCIDMNMCIHPDMWPHSESPWMWLCSETPCTYQHLTVLRNFMYVYANNDSTQTLYMWTCTYLLKCDCYWKLHECEHTCTQRYMTLCGNNFMWRCIYILTFDCAKRL